MTQNEEWKILFVDDEEGIRRVMRITLSDAGYQVWTAADATEGLRLCGEFSPHIVITDIRMPGMDGIQLLEALKQRHPDVEVIVATAFGDMDVTIRALQLDASDFVTKPVSDEALGIALDRAKSRYSTRKKLKDYTHFLEEGWNDTTRELMETFAFQNRLIESSMDGIMGCDGKEIVVTFNKSMEDMLGYAKKEVLHRMALGRFFPPGEERRFRTELAGEKHGGPNRLFLFETELLTKDGGHVPVQLSASVIFDKEQRTESQGLLAKRKESQGALAKEAKRKNGLVCFFRDLRNIRKLEREMADQARILHQDKMMSLGRLAASVVHEINNPLAGILNYGRLMSRIIGRGPLTETHREKFGQYLDLVVNETDRCSRIVSGLLTFSRKSPPEFGDVRPDELLRRCVLMSRHRLELSRIRIETRIPPDMPPIRGDFNQLQQCLINLIFNAMDAMPGGGTLTLAAGHDPEKKTVSITVADTGTGISEKDLSRIFEPFFTTKKEGYGVGLGLSTLYGVMERHGGKVGVRTRMGDGTAFTLCFGTGCDS